jgi:hypothetical protein
MDIGKAAPNEALLRKVFIPGEALSTSTPSLPVDDAPGREQGRQHYREGLGVSEGLKLEILIVGSEHTGILKTSGALGGLEFGQLHVAWLAQVANPELTLWT